MKRIFITLLALLCGVTAIYAQRIERVEPPCWWEGMTTSLQLMLYGEELQGSKVRVVGNGLKVKKVHNADSPNYLFIDLEVERAGNYEIEVSKGRRKTSFIYEISERRDGSAERKGFDSADAIYLIMPDRFANGDTSNDVIEGSPQNLDRSGLEDRHGGDIQGMIDKLDYLADLGVTAIWPTPMIKDEYYYHSYIHADYYLIDPHFGTNELYKEMVSEAHGKGLKVIQDIVLNHCESAHWWMGDLPFVDWLHSLDEYGHNHYTLSCLTDPYASEADKVSCTNGWFYGYLPDMNLSNPYVLQYFVQNAVWWIEYADLDGLRVDTFFYIGSESGDWVKAIMTEYPNFSIVGEVWGDDAAVVSRWVGGAKNANGYDSNLPYVMDFPLQKAIITGLASDNPMFGGSVNTIYSTLAQDFLYDDPSNSLVVFADNHDITRLYDMLHKDIAKVKMAMTIVTTTRGLPQIYAGTEFLFESDPRGGPHAMRMDFPGGWADDEVDWFTEVGRPALRQEMFTHVRTLLNFRKQTPVIHYGKLMQYVPRENMYTYFRYDDEDSQCVMVIVNASEQENRIEWERYGERLSAGDEGVDILTGKEVACGVETTVPPKTSMVINFR